MRIFLTGSTGFIGSHFLRQALATGHNIFALRRRGSQPRLTLKKNPYWLDGVLTDDWSSSLVQCDILVHMAACGVASGSDDWDSCFKTNVIESLQLWRQAIACGINRFLIVGSCFEYGRSGEKYHQIPVTASLEPTTAYAASKAAASMAALSLATFHNLHLVVARPFHVYGIGETTSRFWPSLVEAANAGRDMPMTTGLQVRDFQPVEESVQQLLLLIKNLPPAGSPMIANLGTGNPMTLHSFAQGEWTRLGAVGTLQPGLVPQRDNEVMRYVPQISSLFIH